MKRSNWGIIIPAVDLDIFARRTIAVCAALTSVQVLLAVFGAGNYHFFTFAVVAGWSTIATLAFACLHGAFQLWRTHKLDLSAYPFVLFFVLLAGINLGAFNPVKGWINGLGFWADPLLVDLEFALFFGNDPWRFLTWLSHDILAEIYSRAWFIVTLLCLPICAYLRGYRLLILFFLIWGPLSLLPQLALQSGGPIFYEALGYGDRFAALPYPDQVANYGRYLWTLHETGQTGLGSGISAMPSVHVMTACWVALLTWPTRARWLGVGYALLIQFLSVAIGWHYAVDGLVGAVLVVLSYGALRGLRVVGDLADGPGVPSS